ncbi:hypothetical protein RvY_07685 [Ramazzottius varieornatus]|uniref:PIG-P domain-containing protein n=1 Tax=Ramazzottius varieornatus TaxID=947166 RepID=A0A1D1V954_RAMVA|nr:hypothetical protein RvY_07685 [Ramazzottius varieornatus]
MKTLPKDSDIVNPFPSPSASPERAIYGFALLLASITAAVVYLVWAVVPVEYLEWIGIDFLPSKYWVVVAPLCICSLVFFIPLCYGFICLRLLPASGIEHIAVDEYSRTSLYSKLDQTPSGGIPPLCDIPLEHIGKNHSLPTSKTKRGRRP